MQGKLIIFSAPSGSGKTTIVKALLEKMPELKFSISATSRKPRGTEVNGKDYHFLSPVEFRKKIKNNEFVEWEEVYPDQYYGTLYAEIQRIWNEGHHVLFDVDVVGGLNLKKKFEKDALSVFVKVPDLQTLRQRLIIRNTDKDEDVEIRLKKASEEMEYADKFDKIIINDNLDEAIITAVNLVKEFITGK